MLKIGRCPITNKTGKMIFSNNPLVPSVSLEHIEKQIDVNNLEHADMFCRTFNLPFDPEMWIKAIQSGENVIEFYTKYFIDTHKENLYYTTTTKDVWKEANKEWEKALTHTELLEAIEPIKADFIRRGKINWGATFNFEDLIKLESQYHQTVEMFDIVNPMQLDAVRKASITSLMIDKALIKGGDDVKALKDLTETHAKLVKMAKIDEMIESSETEVLRTVADLSAYLESKGFEFEFYDNYPRDVVDKTIEDIKEYLRTLVMESTGLDATLDAMSKKYQAGERTLKDEEAFEELPLEELVRTAREEEQAAIDAELYEESILDEYGDYDDEDF